MAKRARIEKVGEYYYNDKDVIAKAEEELKAVDYMKLQLKGADSATVFEVYESLAGQHSFETEVGMELLETMYNYLCRFATYKTKLTPLYPYEKRAVPAPVVQESKTKARKEASSSVKPAKRAKAGSTKQSVSGHKEYVKSNDDGFNYATAFRITFGVAVMLAISVIFMCIVAASTDNVTILNYENKLIDRYSSWEKQLSEKEEELKFKEFGNQIKYGIYSTYGAKKEALQNRKASIVFI